MAALVAAAATHQLPEQVLHMNAMRPMIGNMGRAQIYRMMKEGTFPKPVRLSQKRVGWRLSDVQKWIAALPYAEVA